jgi:hypothetical protein
MLSLGSGVIRSNGILNKRRLGYYIYLASELLGWGGGFHSCVLDFEIAAQVGGGGGLVVSTRQETGKGNGERALFYCLIILPVANK